MIVRLPPSAPGLRVGLYGGSFNPAHAGHLHVSQIALRRLGLDRVWWMVSPGNPLKDRRVLAPLAARVAGAEAIARDPRIAVTGFETAIGARYTRDSLAWLLRHRPGVHFVWIMGADSLASFHRWQGWRDIARTVPVAVIDRPGFTLRAIASPAARALRRFRLDEREAACLAGAAPPAWTFIYGPRSDLSSTALRHSRRASDATAGSESTPR
ncbi:nicotinate-nucleotide adenylyltransferase [Methylobacterium sp. ID0610]|uniref:nicotinate-nucleotide adenylyltransferase n=1 Tax=Methylobacterium carpenticola TaxID=3344827 RepID=UPI00367B3E76